MPLKRFFQLSAALRFDDRATRGQRDGGGGGGGGGAGVDKLAPVREVWDAWTARLPLMYDPGPHVTVDEQLVPFRGRCGFRQFMPRKPARYGLKTWVACDAESSYACAMRLYTGKSAAELVGPAAPPGGCTLLGERVVMELTEGMRGRTVTCDNFFTSLRLALRLSKERGLKLLGTVRKNRPELPASPLEHRLRRSFFAAAAAEERRARGGGGGEEEEPRPGRRGRPPVRGGLEPFSSVFAFTRDATLVCYAAKKNRSVTLLSTAHGPPDVDEGGRARKPLAVLAYNRTKGGVDNLDKLVAAYSCRRATKRWPVAVFHNMLDVSAYNGLVLWRDLEPRDSRRDSRRLFLERVGRDMVFPLLARRVALPRAPAAASMVRRAREEAREEACRARAALPPLDDRHRAGGGAEVGACRNVKEKNRNNKKQTTTAAAAAKTKTKTRMRCGTCKPGSDRKTTSRCVACAVGLCRPCSVLRCRQCDDALLRHRAPPSSSRETHSPRS